MSTIEDWLSSVGMSDYAQRFVENDIDMSVLRHLTDQDPKEIGVSIARSPSYAVAITKPSLAFARQCRSELRPSLHSRLGQTQSAATARVCHRQARGSLSGTGNFLTIESPNAARALEAKLFRGLFLLLKADPGAGKYRQGNESRLTAHRAEDIEQVLRIV